MQNTSWSASENYPHGPAHVSQVSKLQNRIEKYENQLKTFEAKLNACRNQRLVMGSVCFGSALGFMSKLLPLWFGWVFLAAIGLFVIWIIKTRRLSVFTEMLRIRYMFLRRTQAKLKGEFSAREWSTLKEDPYPDLHIFGPKSVCALVDETFSLEAGMELKTQLAFGLPSLEAITMFQEKVKPLAANPFNCERFLHLGHLASDEPISSAELEVTLEQELTKPGYLAAAVAHSVLFPAYLTVFFMIGYGQIKAPLSLPVVLYALFSLLTLKTISGSFRNSEIMERYLSRFSPTLKFLESKPNFFKGLYTSHGQSFNKSIGRLKLCVSFLSIQSHGLAYVIVNGLMPWSFVFTGIAEHWRQRNKDKFISLLAELRQLEILSSAALLNHYHSQTHAEFSIDGKLEAKALYHPIIPRSSVVANDMHLDKDQSVILLTGSNMSGKSTFMRAVAVNQILAQAGFSVFAESFHTIPANVVSCLQVKDDLEEGYSYFYSEVRKVKDILDRAHSGESLLFFIDEIFKGTNNKERFQGSKAVIASLSESNTAMGIVSTHDLELSHLADTAPTLENYHFRDDVESSQLVFNYKLQRGPCPTTNALKIMASEGLPVEIS